MHSPAAGGRAVLIVLDGFGIGESSLSNAIENAQMPFYRDLVARYPHSKLITHGEAVGLPPGIMGNSEVGHTTMGAGRIIYQDLSRISKDIHDRNFGKNEVLRRTILAGAEKSGRVHLMGLLSDGGVHSTMEHLFALLDLCAELQVPQVFVHAFLDGRDTPPTSSTKYIQQLFSHPALQKNARLASIMGRYHAMDRDKRWERVERAYDLLVDATGDRAASWREAVEAAHARGEGDEFVAPVALPGHDGMRDGDGVLMANFRADRAREILSALLDPAFDGFARRRVVRVSAALGMVEYSSGLARLMEAVYPPEGLANTMGEVVARAGLSQLRIAETEKYAHVTFFFNGGEERSFPGEERVLVPSPRVATYDLQPEMSAPLVTDRLLQELDGDLCPELIVLNLANADMVGHTGILPAAITAVRALDDCLGRLVPKVLGMGGTVAITADHGNCEMMVDPETGQPHTAHTLNPVPFLLAGEAARGRSLGHGGRLCDIAPTLLPLMGLKADPTMDGVNLLR